MDTNPIQLIEAGELDQLTKWTKSLDKKKLRKLISDQKGNYDFVEYLQSILTGCRETGGDCPQRFYIFCHCLDLIHANELQTKVASDLVGILLLETDSLTGGQLAELTQRFIDIVKNGCVQSEKALELLPKLLSSIETQEKVVYGDNETKGPEYKSHVINTLCSSKWDGRCVIHLAAVFKDVPLSSDELRFVIDKIIRSFSLIDIQDLPALVYQLLLLTAKGHKKTALEGIIQFFTQKDSEQTTDDDSEDLLQSSHSAESLHQTQGTVILHVTFATKLDQDLGCALVKYLKSTQQCSTYSTLTPFVLALSLSIGRIPRFRQQIFDFLKTSVLRSFKDQQKHRSSFWIRQMVTDDVDIEALVLQTVHNSVHGWDHVTQGLVELGFTLMDSFGRRAVFGRVEVVQSSPPGPTQFACKLGASLLLHTFKLHEIARAEILEQIINRVLTRATSPVTHYVDLLTAAVRCKPQVFLESVSRLRDMFDYLPLLPPCSADALLNAVQPLLKLSVTLKDALILVLRKSLFSRQLDSRKVGINGFLLLLKNFRVLGALPCSQSSQSFSLSQVQVDVHQPYNPASNEALCLEVIANLKRCFNQQADIRMLLYEGLYEVICKNSQVCGPVLDVLTAQINKYYEPGRDTLPPLKLDPCIMMQGGEVFLVEPLAHLVACCQRVVRKTREVMAAQREDDEDEDLQRIHEELTASLTSLTQRLSDCELEDFQLDKSADFSLSSSVGVKNNIFTMLLLGVYESLIEYTFLKCDDDEEISEEVSRAVVKLFSIHNKLSALLKEKTGGAGAKKPKTPAVVKNNKSLLSLHFVKTMLDELYNDKRPTPQHALDILRADPDFALYIVTTATHKLQQIHDTGSCDGSGPGSNARLHGIICSIARVLLKCYTENQRCDTATKKPTHQSLLTASLDGLQLVYKITLLEADFSQLLTMIEREHGDSPIDENQETRVMSHIKKYQRLINNILTSCDDMYNHKDLPSLLTIIQSLHRHLIPGEGRHHDVLEWVDSLCQQQEIEDGTTCKLLLSMLVEMSKREKSCLACLREMSRDVHSKLADIDQEIEVETRSFFGVISKRTAASTALLLVTQQSEVELEDVEWLIGREKARLGSRVGVDDSSDAREKHICSYVGQLITVYHELVQTAFPAGPGVGAILKVVVRLYGVLMLLAKYFLSKYSLTSRHPTSKFGKLVKLSGTHLTQHVYAFISYVQTVSNEQIKAGFDKGKKSKKKMDAAAHAGKVQALKETKLIPCLIYAIEQYECQLIQLSKKLKVNLMEHMKQSTSRDFRINISIVEQRMGSESEGSDDEDEEGGDDGGDEGNDENEQPETNAAEKGATSRANREPTPPPKKKARKTHKPAA